MTRNPPTGPGLEPGRADAALVELCQVTKRFGHVTALDSVNLRIPAGHIVGLLGPNGAGKTTMIALLSGLLSATSGSVRVLGGDPRHPATRTRLGLTPQETSLPAALTIRETIDLVATHFPNPRGTAELLDAFDLTDVAGRRTTQLSGGQRRRLTVALATVGRPRLLILDEPTAGLDTASQASLWRAVQAAADDGASILLTSHQVADVERLADRVVLLNRGRVLIDDTVSAVLARVNVRRVSLRLTPDGAARLARATGAVIVGARDGAWHSGETRLTAAPPAIRTSQIGSSPGSESRTFMTTDSDTFIRTLVASGEPFSDLVVRPASLEEAIGVHSHADLERVA